MKTFMSVLMYLFVSSASYAQCFGPGSCEPVTPPEQREICFGSFGCMPVQYSVSGVSTIATVTLPNGYVISGISGPCFPNWNCSAIENDADRDLTSRLSVIHRFQRYLGQ